MEAMPRLPVLEAEALLQLLKKPITSGGSSNIDRSFRREDNVKLYSWDKMCGDYKGAI